MLIDRKRLEEEYSNLFQGYLEYNRVVQEMEDVLDSKKEAFKALPWWKKLGGGRPIYESSEITDLWLSVISFGERLSKIKRLISYSCEDKIHIDDSLLIQNPSYVYSVYLGILYRWDGDKYVKEKG